jgi:hypothetical protein
MAELSPEEKWGLEARARLDTIGKMGLTGNKGMAEAMVLIARTLKAAPTTLMTAKGFVSLNALNAEAVKAEKRILADDFKLSVVGTDAALFLALASQLKALDKVHADLVATRQPFVASRQWRVEHELGADFLIPRPGLYRGGGGRAKPKAGKEDVRIAVKWRDLMSRHRLLPVELDGIPVVPHWRHMRGTWPRQAGLAAAFFEGLGFLDEDNGESFVVTGVSCEGQDGQLAALLAQGHEAQAAVMVLPELTMPPNQVEVLLSLLRDREPWAKAAERQAPGLIVAGSWHEPQADGTVKNVAPVYDAFGEHILSHDKLFAFNDDGIPERLTAGDKIHVLVTEDALVSFGICRDFCDRTQGAIFPRLDVDFVLVTSCGQDSTMEGHIRTAQDMVDHCRGRAFVVQYAYPKLAEQLGMAPIGYVLPPSNPKSQTVASTLTDKAFSVHPAD